MTEKLMQNPLPVDTVARRVVFAKGDHWDPKVSGKGIGQFLPPKSIDSVPAGVWDLTGAKRGRLTIVGLSRVSRSAKTLVWVIRCSCGAYFERSAKKLFHDRDALDACAQCKKLQEIQGMRP